MLKKILHLFEKKIGKFRADCFTFGVCFSRNYNVPVWLRYSPYSSKSERFYAVRCDNRRIVAREYRLSALLLSNDLLSYLNQRDSLFYKVSENIKRPHSFLDYTKGGHGHYGFFCEDLFCYNPGCAPNVLRRFYKDLLRDGDSVDFENIFCMTYLPFSWFFKPNFNCVGVLDDDFLRLCYLLGVKKREFLVNSVVLNDDFYDACSKFYAEGSRNSKEWLKENFVNINNPFVVTKWKI